MGVKKVCPYCKKVFITQKNAKVFCKKRCADLARKKSKKNTKYHLCQWCAKKFHPSEYRTKFCSGSCRGSYICALKRTYAAKRKRVVKRSTAEVVCQSRAAGLSYGVYVGINTLD